MPSLTDIRNDPDYVNANAATKKAIFDKWAPQDPDYNSANAATQQAIRQKWGATGGGGTPAPTGPPPPKPKSLTDYLSLGGRDIIEGAGGLISSAIGGAERFIGQDNPVVARMDTNTDKGNGPIMHAIMNPAHTVTSAASKLADALGLAKADTPLQEIASAGVKGATAALVPGIGEETAATEAAPVLAKFAGSAKNAIAGALSGISSESVNKMLPDATPDWLRNVLTFGAGVAGGVGGAAATSKIGTTAADIAENTRLSGQQGAENVAARQLQAKATDPQAALANILSRPEAGEGITPTMAEQASDPGLAAFQRSITGNADIAQQQASAVARAGTAADALGTGDINATQAEAVAQANRNAQILKMRAQRGVQTRLQLQAENAQAQAELAAQQAKETQAATEQGTQAVQQVTQAGQTALDTLHGNIGDDISPEDNAKAIREPFQANHQDAIDSTGAAYSDIDVAPVKPNRVQAASLNSDIQQVTNRYYSDLRGTPDPRVLNLIQAVNQHIKDGTLNTTILNNVDKNLSDLAGAASAQSMTEEASAINAYRDAIRKNTDPLIPQTIKDQTAIARAFRNDQYEKYEHGAGGLINGKQFGINTTSDLELAGKLVQPGDAGATIARQLKAAVGDRTAETFVRGEMRRLADDGQFATPDGVRAYRPLLNEFPAIRDDVLAAHAQTVGNAADVATQQAANTAQLGQQAIDQKLAMQKLQNAGEEAVGTAKQATKDEVGQQKEVSKALLNSPAGKMVAKPGATIDPHAVITDMLNNGKDPNGLAMGVLHDQVASNPDAVAGVRSSMGRYIREQSTSGGATDINGTPIPQNKDTLNAINNVLAKGGKFLEPEQRATLEKMQEQLARAEGVRTGGLPEGEAPPATTQIPEWHGETANVIRVINKLTSKFSNQKQVAGVLEQAVKDPAKAADLLGRPTPDRIGQWNRTLRKAATASILGAGGQ